jgi:hypothetical protein
MRLLLLGGFLLSLPFVLNPGFETVEEILWIHGLAHESPLSLLSWNPLLPGFYRPLSYLAIFLPFHLFGSNPYLVHAFTALLNLLNAALFYRLLLSIGLPKKTSSLSFFLFLLAPSVQPAIYFPLVIHDQLCASFLLGFFLWLRKENVAPARHGAICLLLALGALLSKESWLLLWPLLLLYGWQCGFTRKWRTSFALVSILALAYFPLRLAPTIEVSGSTLFYEMSFGHNVPLNLFQHYLFHFLPGLGIIYRMFQGTGGIFYQLSLPACAAIGFALLGVLWKSSGRNFLLFLLYFSIALGPVLFLRGTSAHQAYLAAFGFALLLAHLASTNPRSRIGRVIVCASLLLFLAHGVVLGVRKHEKADFQNRFLASFRGRLMNLNTNEPLAVLLPGPHSADYMELNVVDFILRRKQDWCGLFPNLEGCRYQGELFWHTFHWMDGRSPPPGVKQVLRVNREGTVSAGTPADLVL